MSFFLDTMLSSLPESATNHHSYYRRNTAVMNSSKEKCVGYANCVPVCSVGAIYIGDDGLVEINTETCVECHNCYRSLSYEHLQPGLTRTIRRVLKKFGLRFQPEPDICPTEAFIPDELSWPRIVRRAFSDPMVTHESTGVPGRGTEEVKTNDVSHRIKKGDVGIVELTVRLDDTMPILGVVKEICRGAETVISIGVSTVCVEAGNDPIREILERQDYQIGWAKVNLRLGRASNASLNAAGGA